MCLVALCQVAHRSSLMPVELESIRRKHVISKSVALTSQEFFHTPLLSARAGLKSLYTHFDDENFVTKTNKTAQFPSSYYRRYQKPFRVDDRG